MAISVLVVYSSNIANDTGLASIPIPTRIQTAINEANQIYQNSGASQRLELKLAQQMTMTSQDEVDTRQTIVNLFADLAGSTYAARGGYAGAIAALRKQNKADVVVFWSTVPSQSAARTNGAQARDAYLVVGHYDFSGVTIAHELGHLQGLWHEDGATIPYRLGVPRFKTIMATNLANNPPVYPVGIAYFSNPAVNYNGVPTGVDGVWDEVRKLNATYQAFENYGEQLDQPFVPKNQLQSIAQVSLGDHSLWSVDTSGSVWCYEEVDWSRYPLPNNAKATMVSTGNQNNTWCLDTAGQMWRWVGAWQQPSPSARGSHLCVGKDGTIWHVGQGSNTLRYWTTNGWREENPAPNITKIAAGTVDNVWALSSDNQIYRREGATQNSLWSQPAPAIRAKDISVGKDGTVMVLGLDNKIQQSTDRGATWRQLTNVVPIPPKPDGLEIDAWEDPGATVLQISVLDPLRAVMLTPPVSRPKNRLWKKVTVEGDWQNVRWESRMDQP